MSEVKGLYEELIETPLRGNLKSKRKFQKIQSMPETEEFLTKKVSFKPSEIENLKLTIQDLPAKTT